MERLYRTSWSWIFIPNRLCISFRKTSTFTSTRIKQVLCAVTDSACCKATHMWWVKKESLSLLYNNNVWRPQLYWSSNSCTGSLTETARVTLITSFLCWTNASTVLKKSSFRTIAAPFESPLFWLAACRKQDVVTAKASRPVWKSSFLAHWKLNILMLFFLINFHLPADEWKF